MIAEIVTGLARDVSDASFERYLALVVEYGAGSTLAWVEPETRARWLGSLTERGQARTDDRMATPAAWVRREVELFWPLAEAGLERDGHGRDPGVPAEPLVVHPDVAQGLMGAFSRGYREASGAFEWVRTPPALRDVHLLDAFGLGVMQGLDMGELERRLLAGCGSPDEEPARRHVRPCLEAYRDGMLRHRLLDDPLAWWVFERYILPDVAYRRAFGGATSGWVVEAADELPALVLDVLRSLAGDSLALFVGLRVDGGVRNPLGADMGALRERWPDAASSPVEPRHDGLAGVGNALAQALGERGPGDRVRAPAARTGTLTCRETGAYPAMLDEALAQAAAAARDGQEVAIIVPAISHLVVWWAHRALAASGVPLDVAAGTNRLTDYHVVRVALLLAELAFPAPGGPGLDTDAWLDVLDATADLGPGAPGVAAALANDPGRLGEFPELEALREWLAAVRASLSLEGVFRLAFARLLAPAGMLGAAPDHRAWHDAEELAQLVGAAERFEAVDRRIGGRWGLGASPAGDLSGQAARFRAFLLSGRFVDRPPRIRPRAPGTVVLATAAHFARRSSAVDLAIWLDVSSPAWRKSDARELVNCRLMSARRPPGPYRPDENSRDMAEKLGRTLLALAARTRRRIRAYSSLLDAEGGEQAGELADYLQALAPADLAGSR